MPISIKRGKIPAAEFVWSVENTKWPVKAACTAKFAVSASRISPTITTSGSWRKIDRSPDANVKPASVFTWIWLTPSILYSTGSSSVTILIDSFLIRLIKAYKVVDLPEPVGPEVRIIPFGREIPSVTSRNARPVIPIFSISIDVPLLSNKRITTCSPKTTGEIAIRKSIVLLFTITENWPSCGIRCSSIFRRDIILIRLTSAGSIDFGNSIVFRNTPSMRHRITRDFSSGSMWISLALDFAA